MVAKLTRNWWLLALSGVAAVIFGILALVWPGSALLALVLVFGAFALADGILMLISGIQARWWTLAVAGVVGMAAGVVTFLWPGITGHVLLYLIAAWAILTGLLGIVAAVEIGRLVGDEWLMIIDGILSVVLGVLLIIFPRPGAVGLVWAIGIYAIISGILTIGFAFRVHGWAKKVDKRMEKAFGPRA